MSQLCAFVCVCVCGGVAGPAMQGHNHGCAATARPAMAANPEDIELGDAEEVDEDGEGDAGEPAADIQLQEKAVPVRPDLSPTSCLNVWSADGSSSDILTARCFYLENAIEKCVSSS